MEINVICEVPFYFINKIKFFYDASMHKFDLDLKAKIFLRNFLRTDRPKL